jgi:hypothetical protein
MSRKTRRLSTALKMPASRSDARGSAVVNVSAENASRPFQVGTIRQRSPVSFAWRSM